MSRLAMAGLFRRSWARITGGVPPSGPQRQSDRDEDAAIQAYEQGSADAAERENIIGTRVTATEEMRRVRREATAATVKAKKCRRRVAKVSRA
jgi:hypothetical protein